VSALFTQCPGNTVQTGTGKVDPARKFQCTTAARAQLITIYSGRDFEYPNSKQKLPLRIRKGLKK